MYNLNITPRSFKVVNTSKVNPLECAVYIDPKRSLCLSHSVAQEIYLLYDKNVPISSLKEKHSLVQECKTVLQSGFFSRRKNPHHIDEGSDLVARVVEASYICYSSLRKAEEKHDIICACASLYHAISGKSISMSAKLAVTKIADTLNNYNYGLQSGDWMETLDEWFQCGESMTSSIIFKKLYSVFNHVIAHAIYHRMGISFNEDLFTRFEENKIRTNCWQKMDFTKNIVGLVLFLLKQGRQAMITGDINVFFVSGKTAREWIQTAMRLRKDFEFLSNPAAVGIKLSAYLKDLDDAISNGKSMSRLVEKDSYEVKIIFSLILELETLQKRHMAAMAAATIRWCPIGLFIYGKPGVAKTTINKALFIYYCSIRGIPEDRALMHYKNFEDDYMSGFKSYHVGITCDDAGQHRPDKVMGVDPSLKELISYINNTPSVTNQAAVEDKGKVPFLCEYVGITSNVPDLNLRHYFSAPFAAMRRLGVRIEPVVKKEFVKEGEEYKIDPSKIPDGTYPDCWTFIVSYPDEATQAYKEDCIVESFAELLLILHPYITRHIKNQTKLMERVSKMKPEDLCDCKLPHELCSCQSTVSQTLMETDPEPTLRDANGDPSVYRELLRRHRGHAVDIVVTNRFALFESDTESSIESVSEVASETSEAPSELYTTDEDVPLTSVNIAVHLREMQRKLSDIVDVTKQFMEVKKDFIKREKLSGYDMIYMQHWFERNNPANYVVNNTMTIAKCRELFYESLIAFRRLPYDRKRMMLTGVSLNSSHSRNWLTFTPEISRERSLLGVKLNEIHDRLRTYAPSSWNEQHMACLEEYVLEIVPQLLHEDWHSLSIISGMADYVCANVHNFRDLTPCYTNDIIDEMQQTEVTYTTKVIRAALKCYVHRPWVRGTTDWFLKNRVTGGITTYIMDSVIHGNKAHVVTEAAHKRDFSLGGSTMIFFLIGMMSSATVIAVIVAACKLFKPKTRLERSIILNEVGRKPTVRAAEKENVWNVTERVVTEIDFAPDRKKNMTHLQSALVRNLLYVEISGVEDGRPYSLKTRAIVIDNVTIMLNNHAITTTPCKVKCFLSTKTSEGINATVTIDVRESMVSRIPLRDIMFICTKSLPCVFKDIRPNFRKSSLNATFDGWHVTKQEDGELRQVEAAGITEIRYKEHGIDCRAYTTVLGFPTAGGDCGSLLIMDSQFGPIIAGMHVARYAGSNKIVCIMLDDELFDSSQTMVQCSEFDVMTDLTQETKLYTDFYKSGTMFVHGGTTGFRCRNKSRAKKSEIARFCFDNGSKFGLNITDRMFPPPMHSWKPQQIALKEYLVPTHSIDELVLRRCQVIFSNYVRSNMNVEDLTDIHVVPLDVAVNGYPQVPNIDAQKFSTSAGYGCKGAKRNYVDEYQFEEWDVFRDYKPEMTEKMENMWANYRKGIRAHPVFTAQLKDEHVSLKKRDAGKVRVFFMCPAAYLSLIRMYTLGMSRVMMRRKEIFKTAVGLNTHSEEWNSQYVRFARNPIRNCVAGDFVGYDKVLSLLISNVTADFFLSVAKMGAFNDEDLLVFETLLRDFVSATVDYFGTFITLLGGEVSGHQLTTFFNSAANVILHMYAYEMIYDDGCFFQHVEIVTLGDDVKLSVSDCKPEYNHTTIKAIFASIGIEYTMADKETESIPYIDVDEVTFLKRTYADHYCLPCKVAPIEKNSIYKMLCYTIESKTISGSEQLAQSMGSALREAFYHEEGYYEAIFSLIQQAPKSLYLEEALKKFPLPTKKHILDGFLKSSPLLLASEYGQAVIASQNVLTYDSYCTQQNSPTSCVSVDHTDSLAKDQSPEVLIQESVQQGTVMVKTTSLQGAMVKSNTRSAQQFNNKQETPAMEGVYQTILQSSPFSSSVSAVPDTMQTSTTNEIEQTVFVNEPAGETNDISMPFTSLGSEQAVKADLGDFLKRPVRIFTYQWLENAPPGYKTQFNPHLLYFNSPQIKSKLETFGLLRCNLKLKFLINGSPFYYGRLGAFYKPFSQVITDMVEASDLGQCQISALPHVWMDVQATANTELVLPFLHPLPWLNTRTQADFELCELELWQFAALRSANGATLVSGVDVTVYAWCDDFELAGYTGVSILQSNIEYKDDVQISEVASAVAGVASQLKNVPVVGSFATATETAARGISKVANFFGYTNVPNINDVQPMKQSPFSLATTSISEPTQKLSVQAKQEISVDRKAVGDKTEDPLSIANFAGREVFLCGTLWETTSAVGTRLFTSAVTPTLYVRNTAGTRVAHTPMSYVSQMFQYWRGSVIFKFKVIRSQFHRGRLHIAWDMNANGITTFPSMDSPGPKTAILDLDETDEVEMEIPYCQARQFLLLDPMATGPTGRYWENGVGTPAFPTGSGINGIIQVRVLNRMTAPTTTSDVNVMVFVRAGSDIEFAAPRTLPSFVSHSALDNTILQSEKVYLADGGANTDLNKVYFGEKIVSLREVLHRSCLSFTYAPTQGGSDVGTIYVKLPLKRYPLPPGPFNNGWNSLKVNGAAAACRVNMSRMTHINWLAPCFLGIKGSVNVNVNVNALGSGLDSMSLSRVSNGLYLTNAQRRPELWTLLYSNTNDVTSLSLLSQARFFENGLAGVALTNQKTNAGLSANLPYYSNTGFHLTDPYIQYSNGGYITDINDDWFAFMAKVHNDDTNILEKFSADVYYSAGPDFDLVFFTYIPIVHYNSYTI